MTGYYDYVLGLIPTALIGITAFLNLVGWSLTVALPTGASVALGLIVHALFVKGPVIDSIETAASNDPVVSGSASSGGTASPGVSASSGGTASPGVSASSGGTASPGAAD